MKYERNVVNKISIDVTMQKSILYTYIQNIYTFWKKTPLEIPFPYFSFDLK